jgi:hypothetical protein
MEADWWARGLAAISIALSFWLAYRKDKTRIALKPVIKRAIGNSGPYTYMESLKVVNNSTFPVWLNEVGVETTDGVKFKMYERPEPLTIPAHASHVFSPDQHTVMLSTLNKLELCYVETADAKRFTEPLLKRPFRLKREAVPRVP